MSLDSLRHNLSIIAFRARATMATEASRAYLNFLWWIIDPLVTMAVFYIVFSVVLDRGTEDYPVFLIIGLVIWQWFGNTVANAAHSIQQAGSLINQVRFSKIVLPLTVVLSNTYKFFFVLGVLLGVLWLAGYRPAASFIVLPLLIGLQLLFIYGASVLVASLIPLLPDMQYIINNVLRAMMFLSAIFYPITVIPEAFQSWFLLNPMVSIIDAYRQILMYQQWPQLGDLLYAIVVTLLMAATATILIRLLDARFARLIHQR